MHDHNLDDLIIDNIEPQNNKLKSLLTIIALMIVILIVAIILTRILLKTPENNDLVFEQQSEELIAPELKLQETPKKADTDEKPVLSNIVENAKPETVEETTAVVKKEEVTPVAEPKMPEIKKEPVLSDITEEQVKAPETTEEPSSVEKAAKDAEDIAYWESVQAKREAERKAKEKMEQKAKENIATVEPTETKKPKVPVVEKPKPAVKPVVVKKPVQQPVTSQPTPESTSSTKYYVQVGSFKTQPSSRIISVIRNNGYTYRILRSSTDDTKKLLIGPYTDRASANRALVQIKDRINKRAFVVKR